MRADILADRCARHIGASSLGFLHTGKRQRTDCWKAAGDEAGTAQEAATIETNARLTADCRCETAATRLALCSLINTAPPPSARISVDLVEGLHIGRVCLVTGLLFIRIRFGRGALGGERPGRGRNQTRAGAHRAQKIATA